MEKGAHNKLVSGLLQESVMEKAVQDRLNEHQREQRQQIQQTMEQKDQKESDDEFAEMMDDPEVKKMLMNRQREFMIDLEDQQRKQKKQKNNQLPGQYIQILQDEFLPYVTKNDNCIVHFFHKDFERCKIVDHHLSNIAYHHPETKILSLDVEKAPFFVQKLQIQVLPCVIMFKKGVAVDRVVGFEDLGGNDNFNSAVLARKFIAAGIMLAKLDNEKQKIHFNKKSKTNNQNHDDSGYDDDDY